MSTKESKIKILIRDYLIDEGILRKKIKAEKLEFGFQFTFPPGGDPEKRRGQIMAVIKPQDKDFIIISSGTQISGPHQNALNSLPQKRQLSFFTELKKFFLMKDVFYRIDGQNYRYEISDQIYLNDDKAISKNDFFATVRKVFNSAVYSNLILGEYCMGKVKDSDVSKSKDISSGSNFSLYS